MDAVSIGNIMIDLPIFNLFPAKHPERLQLFVMPTPNGIKASAMLEETGLAYEAHRVDISKNVQFAPEYVELNPNSKIPVLVDPAGYDGKPFVVLETGEILQYLAEKSGKFVPSSPQQRSVTNQWLLFQVAHIGPMFGQFGHFYKFAKSKCDHPYPVERYRAEVERLLGVLDTRLSTNTYVAGEEFGIADIMIWPWIWTIEAYYDAAEAVNLPKFEHVNAWLEKCLARPASKVALTVGAA